MALGRNVQFRSAENVLAAYRANNVPAFAVSAGSQLLTSYSGTDMDEGSQLLEKFLDLLEDSQSAATYSVRVYKGLKKGEDISNKTPYHGSFNFNLTDQITGSMAGFGVTTSNGKSFSMAKQFFDLQSTVEKQQEILELLVQKLSSSETEEKEVSMGETLLASILPHLPVLIEKLFPEKKSEPGNQQISGFKLESAEETQARIDRVNAALEGLKNHVQDLPLFLEKLLRYANKNPQAFKLYQKYL